MLDQIFADFPVLYTEDLVLRKIYVDSDYQDYFSYMTAPKVTDYLAVEDIPKDLESAKTELGYWAHLFDYKHSFYWAICTRDSNKIIGTCGFNHWNKSQRRAEISYDVDGQYWGAGVATNAVIAISNFGLHSMNLQRIQAVAAIDNIPSIKVLEKSGYTREGILRKYGVLKGVTKDFYMYTLLN